MKRKRKKHPPLPPRISSSPPLLPSGPSHEDIKRMEEERTYEEEAKRRRTEVDAQVKKERDEKEAKIKALDEKIRLAQTELTLLEKALFDAQHGYERAQIDLTYRHDETSYVIAKESADLLHDTRLLLIARVIEHNRLVDERNKFGISKWLPWAILGGLAVCAMAAYWLFMRDKKKP